MVGIMSTTMSSFMYRPKIPAPENLSAAIYTIRQALGKHRFPAILFVGITGAFTRNEQDALNPVEVFVGFRSADEYYDVDDIYRWFALYIRERPIKIQWMREGELSRKWRDEGLSDYRQRLRSFVSEMRQCVPAVERDSQWLPRNVDFILNHLK